MGWNPSQSPNQDDQFGWATTVSHSTEPIKATSTVPSIDALSDELRFFMDISQPDGVWCEPDGVV